MVCGLRGHRYIFERRCFKLTWLDIQQERARLTERAATVWFRLRHSRLLDNVVALYVVLFANYLLPLITGPYIVRVLSPSGYGLGSLRCRLPASSKAGGLLAPIIGLDGRWCNVQQFS